MPTYLPLLTVLAVLLAFPPPIRVAAGWAPPWRGLPRRRRVSGAEELAWVEALVAELGSGRDPSSSLVVASEAYAVCPAAVAVARTGGDVARALESAAGSPLVRGVAACWEVAQGSGTGLAASLATLADASRETERVRGELRTGLAEPRATAMVLAALPALGLALGAALGADPLSWLTGSGPGRLVLAAGLALEALGVLWSWRIAVSLEATL